MQARSVLFASLFFVGACTSAPAPEPEALSPKVQGSLNQVMRGILFPNSNIIFDAQDSDPAAPVKDDQSNPYAGVYGGWEKVENASIALAEAANLVSLPGRTCQNGKPVPREDEVFQKGLTALRAVALDSYKAAQAKNQDAMLDIADKLTQACATCHDVFRDRVVDGKPIGMADRCTK